MNECKFDRKEISAVINQNNDRIELAKKRQVAVWNGKTPDKWPMTLTTCLNSEQEKQFPAADFKSCYYDSETMLYNELRNVCSVVNCSNDAVPSIRANMGCGIMLASIGLEQEVFSDKMPWLHTHLSKAEISKIEVDDIKIQGSLELGFEHMKYFRKILGDTVPVYVMDHQGPFDLAHMMLGDDIFMEFYDDPSFIHHLLELCVEMLIKIITTMKELMGEPENRINHRNALYAENMGIRICEDTTAIVGPDIINDFIMPYTQRLAQHFGGAWVHYCGRNDNLTDAVCQIPEIRGVNFGHIPGHEDDHIFEEDMNRFLKHKKVYFGDWPRFPEENGKDYLKRLHSWAEQGCLIPSLGRSVAEDDTNMFHSSHDAAEYWYSL